MSKTTKDKLVIKRKKQNIQIILTLLLCICITACGTPADTDYEIEDAEERRVREDETVTENGIKESEVITESATEENEVWRPEENNVIMAYTTENIEYSDIVVPAEYEDDLSFIEDMKYRNSIYAYQDGKVYYRRYHEDAFEETGLWGYYRFVPETKKEIVCIDSDGRETELFDDQGYGNIYLIDDRFYMTGAELYEEDGVICRHMQLYSVDMQGNDRIDYGNGKILAIDRERNIIIVEVKESPLYYYYVIDYKTGEKKAIDITDHYPIYQDGWLYHEETIDNDYFLYHKWYALSLEGEEKEIIAITSECNNWEVSRHGEGMVCTAVDEDRTYFIYGGYDGSANVFQGGKLVSVKHDGTDYKAVPVDSEGFYLCHENGRPLVYFDLAFGATGDLDAEYGTYVWDVEADICYPSTFPEDLLYEYFKQIDWIEWYSGDRGTLCQLEINEDESNKEKTTNIYAIPDDSGKIVRIIENLENYITKWENEEVDLIQYEDLYYADGFLYFTVEYSAYDQEASIGWRDGYRRLRSDVYRLKIGNSAAQVLYSY